jgi:hypothetical protein
VSKAKEAGEIPIGPDGAKLKDVLRKMLTLPPDAVKRVKKAPKKKAKKR